MAAAPLRPIRSDTMKSIFRFALLLLLPAASLTACVTGNKGYVRIPSDLTDITLIGTNPTEITLEASDDWYVRIFYEEGDTLRWLNATPLSGRADETSVTLTAKTPNYTTQPRRAEVQFKLPGDAGTVIRVTQQISPKPQPLTHLTRSLSGATLEGPAELTFQYDEELENTPVFSDGTTTYTLTRGTSNGTIATATSGGTGSFSYTAVNGRITALGPLQWEFRDRNTGILLQRSNVTFTFSYDRTEDKKLVSVSRTEEFTVEEGVTLEQSRQQTEIYEFVYDNLRIASITHTLPYSSAQSTASRSKLAYTFTYPENDADIQENNLTTNVWDLVVMPGMQGTPFYTFTGFGIFGLTGDTQGNFPISAQVTYIAPEAEDENALPPPTSLPQQMSYTFTRDNNASLTGAQTVTTWNDHTETSSVTFSYTPLETDETPDETE